MTKRVSTLALSKQVERNVQTAITFTIPGKSLPECKRQVRRGNFTRRIDTPERADYKAFVKLCAVQVAPPEPLVGPLRVTLEFRRRKSSGYRKADAYPYKRPDLDNLEKIVFDACTGILWRDDSLICSKLVDKVFADREECEVTVEELHP